jgi:hypothetical protein
VTNIPRSSDVTTAFFMVSILRDKDNLRNAVLQFFP